MVFGGQGADPAAAIRQLPPQTRRALGELLEVDLERALRTGSPTLDRTECRQPLQVAASLAVARRLPAPALVLGHSLGALTARAHALDMPLLEAARMAWLRARIMREVASSHPGDLFACSAALARVLVRELPDTAALAAKNAADEWVLAVLSPSMAYVIARGGRRLHVGGPWHGPWMQPAVEPAREALAPLAAEPAEGAPGVIAADDLPADIARPLDWVATLHAVSGSADRVLVAGPGRAHRALVRQALPRTPVDYVELPDDAHPTDEQSVDETLYR